MRSRSALVLIAALSATASAQATRVIVEIPATPPLRPPASATAASATRAPLAPVLDGIDDDPIWAQAQIIESFRQYSPQEDGAPTFRTSAKVVYDDRYLYVFVRMYDPHPDSIVGLLGRRDFHSQSDWIKILVDSYHDKRTGYEFAVNPRGVKRDLYTYNDLDEDESWDGIWDVATNVDSLGWTAEFRIPFDQLRFTRKDRTSRSASRSRARSRASTRRTAGRCIA